MKAISPDCSYNTTYINGSFVKIVKTNHLLFITWFTNSSSLPGSGDNVIQVTLLNDSVTTFSLRTNTSTTSYTEFVLPLACKSVSIISEPQP